MFISTHLAQRTHDLILFLFMHEKLSLFMYVMGVNSQVFFDELAVSNDAFELSGF